MSDLLSFLEWATAERARLRNLIADMESRTVVPKGLIASQRKIMKAIDQVEESFRKLDRQDLRVEL